MAPASRNASAASAASAARGPWRLAAGLLLVFPVDDTAHLVLTVRASTLGRHRGQVSLPGGAIDPGETVEQAALREASEEVGLAATGIRTIGRLTPVDIAVSGFRLNAVVAVSAVQPAFRASDREVAKLLIVPVSALLEPSALGWVDVHRSDRERLTVPAFRFGGEVIWGATAMILAEFLTVLGWAGPGPEFQATTEESP